MNQVALWTAIYDRLRDDDADANGLFTADSPNIISGVYNTMAPTARTEGDKYIVFTVAAAEQGDAFSLDVVTYTVYLSVFTPVTSGLEVSAGIIDRVYGDAIDQAGRVPTYGLHRWKPTLTGDWVATHMQRVDQNQNHSEDVYNFVEVYRVTCSKA